MKHLALWLLTLTTLAPAQNKTIPPFTGTWTLDLHRSTFEGKAHPPIAAEVVIRYDGTHWHDGAPTQPPTAKSTPTP